MLAFVAGAPLPRRPPSSSSARASSLTPRACAPGFRGDDEGPRTSFGEPNLVPRTPNERVMASVRDSMERLGVPKEAAPPPPSRKPVDISRVNPFSALLGSAGAGVMFWAAWHVLQGTVAFYMSHPFESDYYVLVRINAVVRTVLVGMFALASGISGVTSLGLFLLCGRTAKGRITGEFKKDAPGKSTGDSVAP